MKISLQRLALLFMVAGGLFAGTASAAVKLSDVFDGNYFSPTADGRGVSVLIAPQANGSNLFFGALFTYDDAGEPTWLILFAPFLEHQVENDEVDVLRFTGGEFSGDFDPAEGESVGTATVTINSCNSISFDLDMDSDSGFPDADLGDLRPVDGPAATCAYREEFASCPAFAQASAIVPRGCELNGVITNQDITLTNDTTWILNGLVRIGDDNANSATITIEPGTVLIGRGQTADYLYISPGSEIFANGAPWAPIVLTSPEDGFIEGTTPSPGDVGGLVVSGNAPTNACPNAPFNCFSEFDQTQRFGGDDSRDSSGEISYFQVRYAGIVFQPNAEVNSFTFQGVGDGTRVHHLQAFRGQDDGVEFFGGTVRVKYLVVTEGGDDAVDWDLGYSGQLQYGLVYNGQGFGEDQGIEGANNPDNFDALPRATPTVANFTFLGNGNGDVGIQFKEGSGGRIFNTVVNQYGDQCVGLFNSPATYNAAGSPADPNQDVTAFNGVIVNCTTNFFTVDGAPFTTEAFFNSAEFENNDATNPLLNMYQPQAGSPALTDSVAAPGDFFDHTSYRGGFDGRNDWTVPWTHQVTGGQ